ncbi:MAG: hypothetical protein ACREB5_01370 [Sphingomonadaceae bacterium]
MAYRAFDEWPQGHAAKPTAAHMGLAGKTAVFSALELRVIALSVNENAASLEPRSRLGGIIAALFGWKRGNPLADPRLEALRRFAVLARVLGDRLADFEHNSFVDAGFSHGQAAWLRRHAASVLSVR